jgi:hypothetical protein
MSAGVSRAPGESGSAVMEPGPSSSQIAIFEGRMPHVVLAHFNDTWWLVKGVSHLNDMLSATEGPDVEIALVTCSGWPDVMKRWEEPEEGKLPWAINPKIVERLKSRKRTTVG